MVEIKTVPKKKAKVERIYPCDLPKLLKKGRCYEIVVASQRSKGRSSDKNEQRSEAKC